MLLLLCSDTFECAALFSMGQQPARHPASSQHPCRWQHAPSVTQMQGTGSPEQLSVVMHTCVLCCRCQDCSPWHLQPALAGNKPMCTHTLPPLHAPSKEADTELWKDEQQCNLRRLPQTSSLHLCKSTPSTGTRHDQHSLMLSQPVLENPLAANPTLAVSAVDSTSTHPLRQTGLQ